MFETHDRARLHNPHFVLEEGAHRWAYVSQATNREWFFVTYETVEQGISSQQQFMIPTARFLLELAKKDRPEQFIYEIQLVSPPWLNEKGSWLMEPIRSIREADDRVFYELMDGQIYPPEFVGEVSQILWSKGSARHE